MTGSPRSAWAAFTAGFVALVLYLPALANGFAYDDATVIVADERIHSFAGLPAVFTSGYWHDAALALYRPLTTLSFAVDWSLAGDSAAWFHLTNALLNAGCVALAFLLLARFFATGPALFGALLFAVHPLHVEAVANVVGRAEPLAAAGCLAACLLWATPAERARGRAIRAAGILALFALSIFAKESAIMLPALLALVDAARGELRPGTVRSWLRRNALVIAGMAAIVVLFFIVRGAVLGTWVPSRLDPSVGVAATPLARVLTALQAWPVYARLLFFPLHLLADYGPRIMGPASGLEAEVVMGGVLLIALVGAGLASWLSGHGRATLGLLWFPVAVLPVSNLIVPIGVLVAERTLYLPSFALSVLAAAAAERALLLAPGGLRVVRAAAVVLLLLLAARSLVRIPEWRSTESIMRALVRDRPDSFRGQWYLARAARGRGDNRQALALYGEAIRLWPYRTGMILETIGFAAESGGTAYANRLARFAARTWPRNLDAQRYLAATSLDMADTVTARAAVSAGLALDPHDSTLLRMRDALARAGAPPAASR